MKKLGLILTTWLVLFLLISCGPSEDQKKDDSVKQKYSKEERKTAVKKTNDLIDRANKMVEEDKPQEAHDALDEVIKLTHKYNFEKSFLFSMMDFKIYTLQLLKRFEEGLALSLELEELAEKIGKKKSPWNCIKIMDCYLGMESVDKALDWMEKAINEKGFFKYMVFNHDNYSGIRENDRFKKLIRAMKDKIGLDKPARDFKVKLLDGSDYELSNRKGKVVLIDFWNVDCPPCVKAFPELQKLHDKYNQKGLEIIGISVDTKKEVLEGFLNKAKPSWKMACSFEGWKDKTVRLYGINSTPATWLVDKQGILREYNLKGKDLDKAIQGLLQ